MGFRILLTLACALVCGVSNAGEAAPANRQLDYANTSAYYASLISGEKPRLAEIALFATMLPKGGDLHHHYSGAIYAETYLDWVDAQKYCIYATSDPALKAIQYKIEKNPKNVLEPLRPICLSANDIRNNDALYRELLKRWSDKDYDNHFHEQPPPDKQFFDTFRYFGPVSTAAYSQGLNSLKERALAENVGYLETMLAGGPAVKLDDLPAVAGVNGLSSSSSQQQVDEVLGKAFDSLAKDKATNDSIDAYLKGVDDAAAGIDGEDFRLRFLSYVSRNGAPADVFGGLYTSFASAQRSKERGSKRMVGINIVGPENGVVAIRDYSLHMKMFAFLKRRFPEVKLSLHAGELTLGMVTPESLKSHIREAVMVAGADRIGHGVDIPYETDALGLLKTMRERKIPVEINLTSNAFILGVKDEAHPLSLYRSQQVPYVISTDDPGVSRNNLSGEYALYIAKYKPGYDELKAVVYNSIRHSFLSEEEKQEEFARLDKRFQEFEHRVGSLYHPPQGAR